MREQLERYVSLLESNPNVFTDHTLFSDRSPAGAATLAEAQRMEPVIAKIMDKLKVGFHRGRLPYRTPMFWSERLRDAHHAIGTIDGEPEWVANSGTQAPSLSVERFHPWVWEAAKTLWNTGHRRPAVHAAASAVSAETRRKLGLGRTATSDTQLMKQAFRPPSVGRRYLKVDDEGGAGAEQDAVRDLAVGCFTAIRNPAGHPDGPDWPEQRALEYLAALSALARWIDGASVATS